MEQVSSQLLALGYLSEPLSKSSRSTALKQLEQASLKLLHARQSDTQFRETLSSNNRELQFERRRLQEQLDKQNVLLLSAQKEQKSAEGLKSQALADLSNEKKAHSQTRDDLVKNRLALQYVKTTAAHDTKRKERENTTATSKFSSSNSSTMAASANQGRVPMPSPDGERVLLETALEDLEGIRQALLSENEQFRIGMANSVQSAEDAVRAAGATPRSLGDLVPDIGLYPEPHFTLPPHILVQHLQNLLDQAQSRLEAIEEGRQQAEQEATTAEHNLNSERINGHKHIADLQLRIAEIEQEIASAKERSDELSASLEKMTDSANKARKRYKHEQEKAESLKSELQAKDMAFEMERRQQALEKKEPAKGKEKSSSKRPAPDSPDSSNEQLVKLNRNPAADAQSSEPKSPQREKRRKRAKTESSNKEKENNHSRSATAAASTEDHAAAERATASAVLANVLFNSPRASTSRTKSSEAPAKDKDPESSKTASVKEAKDVERRSKTSTSSRSRKHRDGTERVSSKHR